MGNKKESRSEAIIRRKKTYGCNGLCYSGVDDNGVNCHICGGIDTCDETRKAEGAATVLAALSIIAIPLIVIGFIVFELFKMI